MIKNKYVKIQSDITEYFNNRNLSSNARLVVLTLSTYLEKDTNICTATIEKLRKDTALGMKPLYRALHELGLIAKNPYSTVAGLLNRVSDIITVSGVKKKFYQLKLAFNGLVENVTAGVMKNITPVVMKSSPYIDINTNKNKTSISKPSSSSSEDLKKSKFSLLVEYAELQNQLGIKTIANIRGYAFKAYSKVAELDSWDNIAKQVESFKLQLTAREKRKHANQEKATKTRESEKDAQERFEGFIGVLSQMTNEARLSLKEQALSKLNHFAPAWMQNKHPEKIVTREMFSIYQQN